MNLNGKNKSIIKRVISCIVCFAMILGMTPVTAHAAEDTYGYTIECCEDCSISMGHTVNGNIVNAVPNVKYEYGSEAVELFFQSQDSSFSGIIIEEDGVEKKCIKAQEYDNGFETAKTCSYTIPTTDFSKNITIKVVNWMYPFDNEYTMQYDFTGNASVFANGDYLEGGAIYNFEANVPVTFTFTPPEFVSESPYRVMLCKTMETEVDITNQLAATLDGTYTWEYTPTDETSFVVDVIWSEGEEDIRKCFDYIEAKMMAEEDVVSVDYSYDKGGKVAVKDNDKIIMQGEYAKHGMVIFEEATELELVVTPDEGGTSNSIIINDEEVDLSDADVFDEATGTLKIAVDPSEGYWPWVEVDFASNGYSVGYNSYDFTVSYDGNYVSSNNESEFPDSVESITFDIQLASEETYFDGIVVRPDNGAPYCVKADDMADEEISGLYHFTIDDFDNFYNIEILNWNDDDRIYEGYFRVDYNLIYDREDDDRGYVLVDGENINSIREFYNDSSLQFDYKYTEGETIDFVMVPPVGMEGKPEKVAICGFEEDYVDIDMSQLTEGEPLDDGRIPYIFSYTPEGGFKLGIWWEEAQYDFDMCCPEYGEFEANYWVNAGADIVTVEDVDDTNNIVKQSKYREEGKVILNNMSYLKVTIAEEYRDMIDEISFDRSPIDLNGNDDRYDPDTGVITWFVNSEYREVLGISISIPGVRIEAESMEMTTTMNGEVIEPWEDVPFPVGEVTLGFRINEDYEGVKGIRIYSEGTPDYCVGFDEMTYDEESGQYLYTIPDTGKNYNISTVYDTIDWTFNGEYVLHYDDTDGASIRLKDSDELLWAYTTWNYDVETTSSFDFVLQNPQGKLDAPYKVLYQINGYEQVEVATEEIVAVDEENGLYAYTFDMGHNAGKGFKLWVYWSEDQYNYEMLESGDEQGEIKLSVSNGPIPAITAEAGEGNISESVVYANKSKTIYNFNYNDALCEGEGNYYSLFRIPLDESLVVDRICIDNWEDVPLDGTDERYNHETKTLSLKVYNGESWDVNIEYKSTGYNLWFDSNAFTVSLNGEAVEIDTEYGFGDTEEYKFVFAPVDRGEETATVYGIKVFTGEGENQSISYIRAETLCDEGDGAYSYTIPDTQQMYHIEIIDCDGCVFDSQYKIDYDEEYSTVKIDDEKVTSGQNYNYTVNGDGTVTFAIDIYPKENDDSIESPYGVIVGVNDTMLNWYYCDEYEPSFVDNGEYYIFTYTMDEAFAGRGVYFMVCSNWEEFNYETCVPNGDGQYQLDYDANVDNVRNVIYSLNYSDEGSGDDIAFISHESYRDRGRIVLDREQTLTFVITPETGKELKDIIVNGGSVMDTVTTTEEGYVFSITVWKGYEPSIHFEFEDSLGYKVHYNPSNIRVTDVNYNVMEAEVLHAYPEGEQEMAIRFSAEDGYEYESLFSGIKVVQRNIETGDETVTFVKQSELDEVYDEGDNLLQGTYSYTITDFSVTTEIMVVDWPYPFDGEYVVNYDNGYDAKVRVDETTALEFVNIEPGQIYTYDTSDDNYNIILELTPPSDFDPAYLENDAWRDQIRVYVTENENEGIQRANWAENLTYDASLGTFTMGIPVPDSGRGLVFEIYWTENEECYKTMEPNPDSSIGEYGIGYTGNSYGTVTVEQSEVTLLEYQTFRDNGKVRTEVVEGVEPIVAVKITPDGNSKLGDICLGDNSLTSGGTPITGCEGVSYDAATDTYTYMWNLNDGYLHIEFDEETEKTIGVSATTKGTLTDVDVSGTAKNVDIVDVEIKDANLNVLASKTGVSVEDGKFTCDFTGLELTHAKAYIVIVTDASDNKNDPADFAEGFFNACNGHRYAYICTDTICAVCGDERTDAPGHSYTSDCDTTCNNCADGTGVREPLADHSYNNQCTDTICTVCGIIRRDAPGHSYTSDCDTTCDVCTDGTGDRETSVEHSYNNQCTDTECIVCGDERTDAPDHSYTSDCDAFCDVCTDGTGDREPLVDHSYSNQCTDTICIECGDERTEAPGHHYNYTCQTKCDNCTDGTGDRVATAEHTYNNVCEDEACADCGETRTAPGHSSSGDCDEVCNECNGALTPSSDHTYDGCEDTICNVCSKVREAKEHKYNSCESTECNNCIFGTREALEHVYDNCEDVDCNNCTAGGRSALDHEYDNCESTECKNCDAGSRTALEHVYDNCEDTECNNCTAGTRAAGTHTYDDCLDAECNVCHDIREAATAHKYTDCTDASCDNEGCTFTREAEEDHKYTDCTDASCDNEDCTFTREAATDHKYTDCTDTSCDNDGCTVTREPQQHQTDGLCDQKCNVCGMAIDTVTPHTYSGCEDAECNVCSEIRTAGTHTYADCAATECSDCAFGTRVAPGHKYTDCVDTTCDNPGCTYERTDAPGHTDDGDCDEACNVCNATLTPSAAHTYDGCEDTTCNVCGNTRKALKHKYTDCEDTICDNDGCDETRKALTHAYTDCEDTTCNNCKKARKAPGHSYKGQTWLKDASSHWQKCANCTATSTKEAHKMVEQADGSSKCSVCGHIVECEEVPNVTVSYRTHIQSFGWEDAFKKDGEMSGTSGMAKRLEGIEIKVDSADAGKKVKLGIQYTTHCQSYGWLPWSADGDMSGTQGEAKRLEAIMIKLTGADAEKYDVYYRVHAQSYGWLNWASNGAPAGTAGYAKRLEGIQIVIVKKGETFDKNVGGIISNDDRAYVSKEGKTDESVAGAETPNITYRTHVQTYGWQAWKYNGQMSGTSGEAKRLEGIEIKVTNAPCEGSIVYTTHVQTYGWQGQIDKPETWVTEGKMSGTSGEAKRLEAICIALTGEMAEKYDVYYRVHAQTYGWLSWTCNGAPAGTAGYAKRLEGIQIVIVPKGEKPSDTYQGITSTNPSAYIAK